MEISVRKFDLLKELLLMQGVVERKTTIPILSNVLAEATPDGRLLLAATDLELGIETSCPAQVRTPGATAIPARKLLDYVRLLPDAEITIKSLENHWIQIRCGRANTRMVGMSRDNFPALPDANLHTAVKVPAAPLAEMIRKTIFSISNEESRYTLNGALLVLKPGSLTLVATDGHRLAHIMTEKVTLDGVTTEIKTLVPKKALQELLALIGDLEPDGQLDFAHDDTHLFFRLPAAGGATRLLTARQLTGQFPNFEAVLPKDNKRVVRVNSSQFAAAIKRVSQFADERSHAIRMRIEADRLTLTSSSSETGESDEELDTQYKDDPMTIGFNSHYLSEFLDAAGTEEVLLEFRDEQSAGQFRPNGNEDYHYRYIVMPMRI